MCFWKRLELYVHFPAIVIRFKIFPSQDSFLFPLQSFFNQVDNKNEMVSLPLKPWKPAGLMRATS